MDGDVLLEVVEHEEPPGAGEEVVLGLGLQLVEGGHGVVDPPESTGDEVGEDNINAVVTSSHHETADTNQADQTRQPVEQEVATRRICNIRTDLEILSKIGQFL